jgi:hypothetical protein
MTNDDGAQRRMVYLGTVDAADTVIIPHAAFAAAEAKLAAERARQKAETEKANRCRALALAASCAGSWA